MLLAVGDVAGHGTQAATTMAQLRHALRALAVTTSDPGVLLGHLNRLTCDLERGEPRSWPPPRWSPATTRPAAELVWAQAGHPPPLLSRAGRTAPLTRPPGPMLGVVEDATLRPPGSTFRIGDVLLLYTDGLVEHRRRGLDDGLAAVIAHGRRGGRGLAPSSRSPSCWPGCARPTRTTTPASWPPARSPARPGTCAATSTGDAHLPDGESPADQVGVARGGPAVSVEQGVLEADAGRQPEPAGVADQRPARLVLAVQQPGRGQAEPVQPLPGCGRPRSPRRRRARR